MTITPRHSKRISGFLVLCILTGSIVLGPATKPASGDAEANKSSPAMQLASLGMKFNGSASCKGSGCHNKAGADAPPTEREHEFNIWKESDKHSKAFATLTEKDSKEIGTKLKIADVAKSEKCLSCHALNVPEKLRGNDFSIKEGNSCESCHGPSEKWLKDHTKKGWQDEMRAKMSHADLMKSVGLYDTRPLVVRAEMCASCHLSIDADMVAAGHPQPTFELAYFSDIEPKHWIDKTGYFNTKVWLAGQVVCVREAMQQLSARAKAKADAESLKSAWQQAMAHATVFAPGAAAAGLDAAGWKTHYDALAGMNGDAANADKMAAEADAIAKICEDGKAKIDAWDPDANKAVAGQLLSSVAGLTGMGTKYGNFGMDQQSMGISSLYAGVANGSGKPDEATSKLIESKLFPEQPLTPENFDAAVKAVAEKLPK
jgi:hypothetical protein